jgi:hypothetical protein
LWKVRCVPGAHTISPLAKNLTGGLPTREIPEHNASINSSTQHGEGQELEGRSHGSVKSVPGVADEDLARVGSRLADPAPPVRVKADVLFSSDSPSETDSLSTRPGSPSEMDSDDQDDFRNEIIEAGTSRVPYAAASNVKNVHVSLPFAPLPPPRSGNDDGDAGDDEMQFIGELYVSVCDPSSWPDSRLIEALQHNDDYYLLIRYQTSSKRS